MKFLLFLLAIGSSQAFAAANLLICEPTNLNPPHRFTVNWKAGTITQIEKGADLLNYKTVRFWTISDSKVKERNLEINGITVSTTGRAGKININMNATRAPDIYFGGILILQPNAPAIRYEGYCSLMY